MHYYFTCATTDHSHFHWKGQRTSKREHLWTVVNCSIYLDHFSTEDFLFVPPVFLSYFFLAMLCSTWDLVPWPGINWTHAPALGAWRLTWWLPGKSQERDRDWLSPWLSAPWWSVPSSPGFRQRFFWSLSGTVVLVSKYWSYVRLPTPKGVNDAVQGLWILLCSLYDY